MSVDSGRKALSEVVEQGWSQVREQALKQLKRTIEGLLQAERDQRDHRMALAQCRCSLPLAAPQLDLPPLPGLCGESRSHPGSVRKTREP